MWDDKDSKESKAVRTKSANDLFASFKEASRKQVVPDPDYDFNAYDEWVKDLCLDDFLGETKHCSQEGLEGLPFIERTASELSEEINMVLAENSKSEEMTGDELMNYDAEYGYFQEEEYMEPLGFWGEHPVVTLCGSTRFKDEFLAVQRYLTEEGCVVLMPGVYGNAGDAITVEQKEMLDELHKTKIDMSDYVFVVNPGNYIGASTWSEIVYALLLGKGVRFLEPNEQVEWVVERHLAEAERLAFEQLDGLLHAQYVDLDNATFFTVADDAFPGEEAYVFDPWVNLEGNNGNVPFISHKDSTCAVNPMCEYPRREVARFVEGIIAARAKGFLEAEAMFHVAYSHTTDHKGEILKSDFCSCLCCGSTFPTDEITGWTDGEQTPICPRCSVDMVFGHAAGVAANADAISGMCEYGRARGVSDMPPRDLEFFEHGGVTFLHVCEAVDAGYCVSGAAGKRAFVLGGFSLGVSDLDSAWPTVTVGLHGNGIDYEGDYSGYIQRHELEDIVELGRALLSGELKEHRVYSPMEQMPIFEFIPKGASVGAEYHPDLRFGGMTIYFPIGCGFGPELMVPLDRDDVERLIDAIEGK